MAGRAIPANSGAGSGAECVTTALLSPETTPANVAILADELRDFHAKTKSWRKVGMALNRSASYAQRVVEGTLQPTRDVLESWYEFRTGKRIVYVDIAVCPVHGEPHVADCHGAPVAAVVALAPGESVRKPGKVRSRKHYHRPCMDDAEYAAFLAWRASCAPS